jgi:hypothetical protein
LQRLSARTITVVNSGCKIRILSISDLHCGNIAGLTPDKFNPQSEDNYKAYCYRRQLYEWVSREVKKLGPIDICVANGDLIDGKGTKSGGVEQIYTSRPKQIEIAIDCLKEIKAKEYHFTYGTGYHSGPEDDWELQIAQEFSTGVDDICTLEPNGLIMKWRHHIGGSQVPSGRATALLRQQEWDLLWSLEGEYKRANVMVFSHVNYFQSITNRYGTIFTHPALQGMGGSQLGARRMGGIVDYGFLVFDVTSKGDWSWEAPLYKQTPMVRNGQQHEFAEESKQPLSK